MLARRVFGFFLVIALVGFGWSVTHGPRAGNSAAARASDTAQAYAACQANIRQTALNPDRMAFPAEPESAEPGDDSLDLASSMTATPRLGAPYTQHFTCRAGRDAGTGAWKVTRLALDLPVS